MSDILPPESTRWQIMESSLRRLAGMYGFQEIRMPLVEEESLFSRSLGGASDIVVSKQMFRIDRGEDEDTKLVLRPEATASVVRAYLAAGMDKTAGLAKFYYLGPMFRAERPQAGRSRQFHQFGIEFLGGTDRDLVDAEIIVFADRIRKLFGLGHSQLIINSVGCPTCRAGWNQKLVEYFGKSHEKLCNNCQMKFEKNVLRIFDCKNGNCKSLIEGAPTLAFVWDRQNPKSHPESSCVCRTRLGNVQNILGQMDVQYILNHRLVRGLDYYTSIVFEMTHSDLGAQDAFAAGGRYDELPAMISGKTIDSRWGAAGLAVGLERLLIAIEKERGANFFDTLVPQQRPAIYVARVGESATKAGYQLVLELRDAGFCVETDYESRSLKAQLRAADKMGAKWVVVVGDDEIAKKQLNVKEMATGKTETVAWNDIVPFFGKRISNSKLCAKGASASG